LQNPKILLLDESTSALDRQNEREIQALLENFSQNRTTITIAHRLSTVKDSDVIFVLEKGRIVEQGTHKSLLKLQGAYSKLARNQLSYDEEIPDERPNQALATNISEKNQKYLGGVINSSSNTNPKNGISEDLSSKKEKNTFSRL
jgi:ATP-binding cassette subfamily B (MDR/TAP) protein 1